MIKFRAMLAAAALFGATATTAHATVISGAASADNSFAAYISTSDSTLGTKIGSGNSWSSASSFSGSLTAGVTNYLHIVAYNWGGPDGFIGSFSLSDTGFQFSNGSQTLVTNATNWTAAALNAVVSNNSVPTAGASWTAPTALAVLDTQYNWGPTVGNGAQWIWSSTDNGVAAAFSTVITQTKPVTQAVPEPATLAILGLGMAGLGLARRRKAA